MIISISRNESTSRGQAREVSASDSISHICVLCLKGTRTSTVSRGIRRSDVSRLQGQQMMIVGSMVHVPDLPLGQLGAHARIRHRMSHDTIPGETFLY